MLQLMRQILIHVLCTIRSAPHCTSCYRNGWNLLSIPKQRQGREGNWREKQGNEEGEEARLKFHNCSKISYWEIVWAIQMSPRADWSLTRLIWRKWSLSNIEQRVLPGCHPRLSRCFHSHHRLNQLTRRTHTVKTTCTCDAHSVHQTSWRCLLS